MSDDIKNKHRISEQSLDENTAVSGWNLPSMQISGRVIKASSKNKKKPNNESIEAVTPKTRPKPLTAEEMQRITEDARKEGFQQGLHEGTEKGITEGTRAGHKAGEKKAYAEAKKDIQLLQNQLRIISTRLFDPMQQQQEKIENLVVDLSLNLAKKLIGTEVSANPSLLIDMVKNVLDSIPKGAKETQVYLCEKDAKAVENLVPEGQRNWVIQRDNSLDSGGCRVESASSLVNFSIEERLAAYFEKIESRPMEENPEPIPDYPRLDNEVLSLTTSEANLKPAKTENNPTPFEHTSEGSNPQNAEDPIDLNDDDAIKHASIKEESIKAAPDNLPPAVDE